MVCVYLLLGSNEGQREQEISKSLKRIASEAGQIIKMSSLYVTEPWGFESDSSFLNQVVLVNTRLSPSELLKTLLDIEKEAGRIRTSRPYSSRVIDIDILFYSDWVIQNENLIIPHPMLHLRRFTLEPLMEIAPEMTHPVFKKSVVTLYAECEDHHFVKKYFPKT